MEERFELSYNRIRELKGEISSENGLKEFKPYFEALVTFLNHALDTYEAVKNPAFFEQDVEALEKAQEILFGELKEGNYESSFANPTYCVSKYGQEMGRYLAFLYWEEMQILPYIYEGKTEEILIRLELLLEVYGEFYVNLMEAKNLHEILYWYVSDYSEDSVLARVKEQFLPEEDFAVRIIGDNDLCKPNYLFMYGEYISENEIKTAESLAKLPEETIDLMAKTYAEGFRKGFVAAGKDLSIKNTVNIRYTIGFERVIKKAIVYFEEMGLKPVIYRASGDIFRKRGVIKIGYTAGSVNRQAEYDHREDLALFLDGHLITRKLECAKAAYEEYKKEIRDFAGPACMETFGEADFIPKDYDANPSFTEEQRKAYVEYQAKAGDLINSYIHMEERSFTIIAFPTPEIGENYEQIFNETIRINTLDYETYQRIQTTLIDTLNLADEVHVEGKDGNETELVVKLCKLDNPEKEAKFENCVADVNIPVGEVFTSPVLEGTEGILHVKKVYINGLKYENLRLEIKDGITKGGSTTNLPENAVEENIMYHHAFLPIGEFAIGTNTTAYNVAQKYHLFEKLPILIAEKTGPHFAFGDTCYSNEEEVHYVNPDGKEMVAKENTYSLKRHENPEEAYFHCHTDITIPYEEIGIIEAILPGGERVALLKDGRFVLPGTEELNIPLDEI